MTKLSYGPLWKENNKWEIVGLCYILSTTNLCSELGGLEGGQSPLFVAPTVQRGGHGGAAAPPPVQGV